MLKGGVSLQKMQKELDKKHFFEAKIFPSWYNHMIMITFLMKPFFCEKQIDKNANKQVVLTFLCVDTLVYV